MTDRLVAFDFDGTLSESEMTVLLGSEAGVAEQIDAITERAMNDEIGYAESLRERVALLEGLSESAAGAAFEKVELRPGLGELLGSLSDTDGLRTAILTGGFDRGVESALERAGASVDRVVANRLVVAFAELTGDVEGPLIDGTKDDALDELCAGYGIQPRDVVAVGDGANDVPMLDAAGLAIGYEPKPAVEPHCDVVVGSVAELENVLDDEGLLG